MADESKDKKAVKITLPHLGWKHLSIALIVALAVSLYIVFTKESIPITGMFVALTPQEAANKAIAWISDYYASNGQTVSVTLVNATETIGVYEFVAEISSSQGSAQSTFYVSKDGKLFLPNVIDITEEIGQPEAEQQQVQTIGNFLISGDEICIENNKPIIYFFGSNSCPHCKWEHPIISNVTSEFEGYISYHDNMDTETDSEVFYRYSTGGVPTLVFGCKYYRQGSGESIGLEQETKVLTALICKLTEGKPSDICSQVQDLISQIQ
ncbi:MAG TPA: thioredoxin family protein [archaeon]|nr:thioredoxin family protein [archaeon]